MDARMAPGPATTAALLRRRPDGLSKKAAGSSGTDAQAQMGYDTRALLGQSSHRAAAPAPRVGIRRARVSPPVAGRCWRTWTPLAMFALGTRLGLTAGARARNLRCSGISLPARLHRPLHHTSLRSSRPRPPPSRQRRRASATGSCRRRPTVSAAAPVPSRAVPSRSGPPATCTATRASRSPACRRTATQPRVLCRRAPCCAPVRGPRALAACRGGMPSPPAAPLLAQLR
jgi:hypothetical protein